ncbi:hypothetical protein [Pseudonocardia alni]|uniref:hypothetical protein n=1 Tax=Pseudonocardia alni TaxID=33907 RepID=UPI0033320146
MTSPRPVIDAGPALNFFATRQERLLFGILGRLSTPEVVRDEVLRKARTDRRFDAAGVVWQRAEPNWIEVLSDDVTPDLDRVVARVAGESLRDRRRRGRDLGELMVVAHAVVAAERGLVVTVVIDDGEGARIADRERRRLVRLRAAGRMVGSLVLVNTTTILERAAGSRLLPDREAMRSSYARLRTCDDGLIPIERTGLLNQALWGR